MRKDGCALTAQLSAAGERANPADKRVAKGRWQEVVLSAMFVQITRIGINDKDKDIGLTFGVSAAHYSYRCSACI